MVVFTLVRAHLSWRLRALLEANGQISSGGDNTLRERLADRMTFGALELCPECPAGELELRAYGCVRAEGR
jgi:hypothetical protein